MKYYYLLLIFFLASSSLPGVALAADTFGKFEAPLPGINGQSIDQFVAKDHPLSTYVGFMVNILTGLFILTGLISIVIAGFFYMTAGGSAEGVTRAKSWLTYALSGIVLALLAWTILYAINPSIIESGL